MPWHSLHVAYHDATAQDDLIVDAVGPLLRQVASEVDDGYFVRHWRRGPHVRVHVRSEQELFARSVVPQAEQVIGDYLATRPSRATVDEDAMLAEHARLAELENEHGELTPLYPDNTIQRADYEHRTDTMGSVAASELLAEFYSATNANCLRQIEWVRDGGQRLGIAFDLMIASCHALSGLGIKQGFISFRSHAESFLNCLPEARGLRAKWDAHYARFAESLSPRVPAAVALADGAEPVDVPGKTVRDWLRLARPLHAKVGSLIERGEITLSKLVDTADESDRVTSETLVRESPFHHRLITHGTYRDHFEGTVWFGQFRMVLNYLYLHLSRLGVKPIERMLLCHLAANAVEETYGLSAMQVITEPPVLRPVPTT